MGVGPGGIVGGWGVVVGARREGSRCSGWVGRLGGVAGGRRLSGSAGRGVRMRVDEVGGEVQPGRKVATIVGEGRRGEGLGLAGEAARCVGDGGWSALAPAAAGVADCSATTRVSVGAAPVVFSSLRHVSSLWASVEGVEVGEDPSSEDVPVVANATEDARVRHAPRASGGGGASLEPLGCDARPGF